MPQVISIDMYIDDIFTVSREGEMEARIRVVERWQDERLKVANATLGERVEIKEDVWTP